MNCLQSWPEPVVRVQSLSHSGISQIPNRYIKPPSHRPTLNQNDGSPSAQINVPVIDFENVSSKDETLRRNTLNRISSACRDWGFFQVVNHGVKPELLTGIREVWREFFDLPMEMKQVYANSPATYEGYGSRLGVEMNGPLDWCDYYFLHYMPSSLRNQRRWPAVPASCRELVAEYGSEVVKFGGKLMRVLSTNLGLEEDHLLNAFGGDDNIGACLRANFYPKCPQPDLTLGLSPHSDPGGMTILLPDENVSGLQIRRADDWITIKPLPNAFIVNIGDQIQVLSNAIYKSVEHRVIVNSNKDRISLAFFYNPKSDLLIQPCEQLVTKARPALYPPKTFDEYRVFIRTKGPCGKQQVRSLTNSS